MGVCLGGGLGLGFLMEVRAHILLEVKIRQFILGAKIEELCKLSVGDNLATILLVLKVVCADVCVDFAGDVGASHLGSLFLIEEGGEFLANWGGLNEATGGAGGALLADLAGLLHGLNFLIDLLFNVFELVLEGIGLDGELLKLGVEL